MQARSPGGKVLASAVTAGNGNFSLPLPKGRYLLVVTGILARCQEVPIAVRGTDALRVSIFCWHPIH